MRDMTTPMMSDTTTSLRQKFRDDAHGNRFRGEYWVPVGFAARLAEIVTAEEILYWDSDAENENGTFRGRFVVITASLCVSAELTQDASERFKDDLRSATVTVRRLADVSAVVLDGTDLAWSDGAPLVGKSAALLRFAGDVDVPLALGGLSGRDLRGSLPAILAASGIKGA
jgi:hypothetical protein